MADAELPGDGGFVAGGAPGTPTMEQVIDGQGMDLGPDAPVPANAPVQELNHAVALNGAPEPAPVNPGHLPQGTFAPLLKSFQGHFPPE